MALDRANGEQHEPEVQASAQPLPDPTTEAAFAIPPMFANQVHLIPTAGGIRITFGETRPAGQPPRYDVAIIVPLAEARDVALALQHLTRGDA